MFALTFIQNDDPGWIESYHYIGNLSPKLIFHLFFVSQESEKYVLGPKYTFELHSFNIIMCFICLFT